MSRLGPVVAELEARVQRALAGEGPDDLEVLGHGEISTVLALDAPDTAYAAKRLPPMDAGGAEVYRRLLHDYLVVLERRGMRPAPSELVTVSASGRSVVPYCVQPRYQELLPEVLHRGGRSEAGRWIRDLVEQASGVVCPEVGLDAQVSNFAVDDDHLVYLDVTTPMLREGGRDRLDTDVFLASLPGVLRPAARRFVVPGILDAYHDLRTVLVDATANLHKERLPGCVPVLVAEASRVVDPPITPEEAWRYYRRNAAMWEVLQRLRRADRWWQRRVRRRVYPFLLPGPIAR